MMSLLLLREDNLQLPNKNVRVLFVALFSFIREVIIQLIRG